MVDESVTAVVVTSPAPLHPSTEHIESVIDSIRYHLPACEIVIVADGATEPNPDYDGYLNRLSWLCLHHWHNVLLVPMKEWSHQAQCIREGLEYVTTPLVLMVEHDCPICPDPIEWDVLTQHLATGASQMIRFSHESILHPEHLYLMLDKAPRNGLPMVRTVQYSQRPHLATKAFYIRMLAEHFPEGVKAFIEDKMYGVIVNYYNQFGDSGWAQFSLWIYTPEGSIKRSEHLDSRAGAEKAPAWMV